MVDISRNVSCGGSGWEWFITVTARLRQGLAGSRSGTPDAPSLRATPPRLTNAEVPSPNSELPRDETLALDSAFVLIHHYLAYVHCTQCHIFIHTLVAKDSCESLETFIAVSNMETQ